VRRIDLTSRVVIGIALRLQASRVERALIPTPRVSPLGPHYAARSAKALGQMHFMCVRLAALCLPACLHTPPPEEAGDNPGGMACITNHHHRRSCNKRRAGRSLNLKRSILRCASRPPSQPSGFEIQSPLIYCDHICPALLQAVMIACILLYCTGRALVTKASQASYDLRSPAVSNKATPLSSYGINGRCTPSRT
jgi:hypothetical protein